MRRQECLRHQKFRESPAKKPRAAGLLRRYLLEGGEVGGGAAVGGGEELHRRGGLIGGGQCEGEGPEVVGVAPRRNCRRAVGNVLGYKERADGKRGFFA